MEGKIASQTITKTILDNLQEGIVIFNDKQIAYVNDNFLNQFEQPIEEYLNLDSAHKFDYDEVSIGQKSMFQKLKMATLKYIGIAQFKKPNKHYIESSSANRFLTFDIFNMFESFSDVSDSLGS
jgi:hypothetical protein